ncbi:MULTISPECIES: TonB-dependent siderophore receptor [Oxalobacteraceae]|uniref:TonB-dependent receptor n=1 Tax=Herminiimonas sp. Marseille-P9896 TaxID=2742211 RepID=UPI00158DB71D|nr:MULTISPECIES: TonB-dependent receptor [Oxalobacteraceae]
MAAHLNLPAFFKPTLLVCALQAALPFFISTAHAQTTQAPTTTQLEAITVTSSADASAEGLSKAYAGGQVARGGRAGILGTQDNMDTPFSITSYTNELIQNQQARSVGDVLQNDPSIRVARGFGNFQESYFVRGFLLSSDNIAYNGLYSLLPRQYISSELFERVEVLHGASTFLTGITPSGDGIGGTINLLPKRAGNDPLTQVTAGTASGSQAYVAADLSRRFGPNDSTGIRINAAHRDGGTGVSRENVNLNVVSVGVDWRSSNARLSADIGHQNHRLNETRTNVDVSGVTSVPRTPDASSNWAQPGSYSDERDTFGTVRGEYDINSNVTTWFAAGMRRGKEANSLGNIRLSDALSGAGTTYRFDNTAIETVKAGELGIRGKLVTGSVKHTLVASYAYFDSERKNAYTYDAGNTQNTNLYNPVLTTLPAFSAGAIGGGSLANPTLTAKNQLTSYAIGDTMSFLDDKVLLTVGARHQTVDTRGYAYGSAIQTSAYKASRVSPAAGIVYKPAKEVSIYANYIESLSPGKVAPTLDGTRPVANAGEILSPYVAKQKEVGVKYDGGRLGASAVVFTTDKPRVFTNAAGIYGAQGTDNHKGLELTAFGEITRGLKILGGVTFLDAKQESSGSATTDGKRVIGVPKVQGSLGAEWDVASVQGFSVNGRVTATGSSYADAVNTLKVPGWARLDIGARYLTEVQGKLVTFRARVDNVTDRNYWASVGGSEGSGYLVLGNPRTFSLTASVDF